MIPTLYMYEQNADSPPFYQISTKRTAKDEVIEIARKTTRACPGEKSNPS